LVFRGRFLAHLQLELVDEFGGAQPLGVLFDLHLLGADRVEGQLHARFALGRFLVQTLEHFVVRLVEPADLELLHRVGHLALPLGAFVGAQGVFGFLNLVFLLAHEALFDAQGLFVSSARVFELALEAFQVFLFLLQAHGLLLGKVVAVGVDGGLDLGGERLDGLLRAARLFFEHQDVGLDRGDVFVHLRHLVVELADVLLQDQARVFHRGDGAAEDRAHGALEAFPERHGAERRLGALDENSVSVIRGELLEWFARRQGLALPCRRSTVPVVHTKAAPSAVARSGSLLAMESPVENR